MISRAWFHTIGTKLTLAVLATPQPPKLSRRAQQRSIWSKKFAEHLVSRAVCFWKVINGLATYGDRQVRDIGTLT